MAVSVIDGFKRRIDFMTAIVSNLLKIQQESVEFRSAVSESTGTTIGGSINGLIDAAATLATLTCVPKLAQFNSTGIFTAPSNLTGGLVICFGAGGGGGGGGGSGTGGFGGNGGNGSPSFFDTTKFFGAYGGSGGSTNPAVPGLGYAGIDAVGSSGATAFVSGGNGGTGGVAGSGGGGCDLVPRVINGITPGGGYTVTVGAGGTAGAAGSGTGGSAGQAGNAGVVYVVYFTTS